ncbi:HET-domain-containing protein [Annulohypoxylon moriforme]|nr:HET-domain-containing protein [Annulohypoxylon moriforme]
MWLLHTSLLRLHHFIGQERPAYAILSHTWGNDEILFQDIQNRQDTGWKDIPGYDKLICSCLQAKRDGYQYIWIDTCCIDKTSSAELSEAINSMFQWYKSSAACYVFLEDVRAVSDLFKSRWFTRGWTLQELIAPETVRFYDHRWNLLGDRFGLAPEITHRTNIGLNVLTRNHLNNGYPWEAHTHSNQKSTCESCYCVITTIEDSLKTVCVAEKMNWVSERETTRIEDIAYCLLGIFGVNMTLIYGEGLNAFRRLQEEILKRSEDQSILTWCAFDESHDATSSFLASHPRQFKLREYHIQDIPWRSSRYTHESVTRKMELVSSKLSLSTRLYRYPFEKDLWIVILDCIVGTNLLSKPALILLRLPGSEPLFCRVKADTAFIVEPSNNPTGQFGQLVGYSGKQRLYNDTVQFNERTGLYRSVITDLDTHQGHPANITIKADSHGAGYQIDRGLNIIHRPWSSVQSRIAQFNQQSLDIVDSFSIVGSIPRFNHNQSLTLHVARSYVVAFENNSSTFFVIWGYEMSTLIFSMQELFRQLRAHPYNVKNCTVVDIMNALERVQVEGVELQVSSSECPKIIGEPGSTRYQVDVGTRLKTFLGSKVLDVRVDISRHLEQGGKTQDKLKWDNKRGYLLDLASKPSRHIP